MMKVPDNVVPFVQAQAAPQIDPKYLAMAAGLMHQEGRLFEPTPMGPAQSFEKTPNQRVNEGHYDASKPIRKIGEFGDDLYFTNQQGDVKPGKVT